MDALLDRLSSGEISRQEAFDLLRTGGAPDKDERRLFSRCWLLVLEKISQENDLDLYVRVLQILDSEILPIVTQPFLFLDFVTESFNRGGEIAILSMKSLFSLITVHSLDYPNFYDRLYSQLNADALKSDYRLNLFSLLEQSLESTHLPAYLVAAFAKKLSRLALTSPVSAIPWIVAFVYNLLKRHPACQCLVDRAGATESQDPFNEDAPIAACNAIESSLWELAATQEHFYHRISSRGKPLFQERLAHPPFLLEPPPAGDELILQELKRPTPSSIKGDFRWAGGPSFAGGCTLLAV